MAQYRVKVSLLNKRSKPEENTADRSTIMDQVKEGTPLELTFAAQLPNGDWYTDGNGGYYWGGGLRKFDNYIPNEEISIDPINEKINLSDNIILGSQLIANGENINIGIFDSGIDQRYNSLKKALIFELDCLTNNHNPQIINSHGTMVAGILVGNEVKISGIAPNARILSYRVIKDNRYTDDKAIIEAVKSIINKQTDKVIDIINLSLDINSGFIPSIQSQLTKLQEQGIIIVVAGGNYNKINNISDLKNVISVGVFEEKDFEQLKLNGLPEKYNACFLNTNIPTTSFSNTGPIYDYFHNDSAYTAVMSGLIANYLSETKIPKEERYANVNKFLKQYGSPIKNEKTPKQLKMYI